MGMPVSLGNLLWNYRTGAAKPDSRFPKNVGFRYKPNNSLGESTLRSRAVTMSGASVAYPKP